MIMYMKYMLRNFVRARLKEIIYFVFLFNYYLLFCTFYNEEIDLKRREKKD